MSGDVARKFSDYELKITQLNQESERMRTNLNMLTQENDVLKRKIKEYENSINTY